MKARNILLFSFGLLTLAACGEQKTADNTQTQLTNTTSVPEGEGWQNLGNGVYKKVTPDGGVQYSGTYKVPSWLEQIEANDSQVAQSLDSLALKEQELNNLQIKQATINNIIESNRNDGVAEMWGFIYNLKANDLKKQIQQSKSPLSAQAVVCTPQASASPTSPSGTPGAKASAYISCSSATNMGAQAHVTINGVRTSDVKSYPSSTYASASVVKYGSGTCGSNSQAGGGNGQSKSAVSSGC